jgi:hypothetical protein
MRRTIDRGMKTNAEVIKQLEKDFGLSRRWIYELMDDEFKKEYKKADLNLDGTSKGALIGKSQLGHLTQTAQIVDKVFKGVKGFAEEPNTEQMLVAELRKLDVVPEMKVPSKALAYPRSYHADPKIGNMTPLGIISLIDVIQANT